MSRTRFGILFFLSFAAVIGLLRFLLIVSEHRTWGSNDWAKERIRGSLQALRNPVLKRRRLALFLGASEAQVGFDPIAYDEWNRDSDKFSLSFNLAVHNNGTFLPLYFERLAHELRRKRLHPAVLFVNFPVSRFTRQARSHFIEMQKTHDLPSVYFSAGLWRAPLPFQDKIEMALNKWVFAEHSLLQFPLFFGRPLKIWTQQTEKRLDQRFFTLLTSKPETAWMARGRFYNSLAADMVGEATAEAKLSSPENLQEMIRQNIACCDFADLNIDSGYVEQVIASFTKISELADHVVIVDLPENPTFRRSPESAEAKSKLLRQIAAAARADFWSFNYPEEYFVDLLHLSPSGAAKFSKELSERTVADWF